MISCNKCIRANVHEKISGKFMTFADDSLYDSQELAARHESWQFRYSLAWREPPVGQPIRSSMEDLSHEQSV